MGTYLLYILLQMLSKISRGIQSKALQQANKYAAASGAVRAFSNQHENATN